MFLKRNRKDWKMKLTYKSPKWDKELKNKEKVWKQLKGIPALINLERRLERMKACDQQNYCSFYFNVHLSYEIAARDVYLSGNRGIKCSIAYTYLSGMAAIMGKLFDTSELKSQRHVTNAESIVCAFDLGLLQMIACNQAFPKTIEGMEHIYIHLFNQNEEKVKELLDSLEGEFNPKKPDNMWLGEGEKLRIEAILNRDEKKLQELLMKMIMEYRKEPVGYSQILDIYSIAFIKLAKRYGMEIKINVIEIPEQFFDDEICKEAIAKAELPFFDKALVALEERGIFFEA